MLGPLYLSFHFNFVFLSKLKLHAESELKSPADRFPWMPYTGELGFQSPFLVFGFSNADVGIVDGDLTVRGYCRLVVGYCRSLIRGI